MPSRIADRLMWSRACEILARAERLHRQFFDLELTIAGRSAWAPPVDIFETDKELTIIAALPGVRAEDLEVRLQGNTLVVAGRRRLPTEARAGVFHRMEIPQGQFERRIALPNLSLEVGRHVFADGCLTLSLRKTR